MLPPFLMAFLKSNYIRFMSQISGLIVTNYSTFKAVLLKVQWNKLGKKFRLFLLLLKLSSQLLLKRI